ncbi:hypothetical protein [Ornithinimicrobium kibberense]|uniref:hypothetical protein n=1 Tax=Ornithinimicrobium kibberense TaxID=282060 RepID=UPI0036070185
MLGQACLRLGAAQPDGRIDLEALRQLLGPGEVRGQRAFGRAPDGHAPIVSGGTVRVAAGCVSRRRTGRRCDRGRARSRGRPRRRRAGG